MALVRVEVASSVLRWAIERSQRAEYLRQKYPNLEAWESGELSPTVNQLHEFARDARVAEGYMYLSSPPDIKFPLPDLRTLQNLDIVEPSPDLIDTVYACQRRQRWFREYAASEGFPRLGFVGSVDTNASPIEVAVLMRETLEFNTETRRAFSDSAGYRRHLILKMQDIGVLVMVNGVVGNNTHRKLNPSEFRGFALTDDLAPVVFVNGADSQAAQLFTLVHELAHIWLGQSALSDTDATSQPTQPVEVWCNAVAAEVLVPIVELHSVLIPGDPIQQTDTLMRHFKVSRLVILRRLFTAGLISRDIFNEEYRLEKERVSQLKRVSGGDFYPTELMRVGRRFARALVSSTLEGHTLYRDAFRLLNIRKTETFNELGRKLGYRI